MPETDTPPAAAEADATPAGPPPPTGGGWPTWLRRTAIGCTLVAALAVAVWGASKADTSARNATDPAIVALFPGADAQAPRQTSVGAELAPGFDGRLVIDGIEIPEEQMEGARDPATTDPQDLADYGIRPNNRNRVYFRPGPGKVIEEFDQGPVRITLRYFRDGLEDSSARTVSWTIRVA